MSSPNELLAEVVNSVEGLRGQIESDNRAIISLLEQIAKELEEIRKRTK